MTLDFAIVMGLPFVLAAMGIAYAAFRSYLKHRERMAMIERGLVPPEPDSDDDGCAASGPSRTSPVTLTLVGIAITLGLLTIGIGPWLIGGLVPTAIGCGMLINQMLKESR